MKTSNQIFLEKLNHAFACNDTEYISEQVTDDIRWEIVGDQTVSGKAAFVELLKAMEQPEPLELEIHNIITHGISASVNGIMTTSDGTSYGFCDIIRFNRLKNPKIREMTSYSIEIKS
ncbi:MAG: nuclear transport factor 2 family protein [Balneolaceae bacterium]|nr:MAG: nuclear transport factor 2 family protein [Balneolaceae bacterium]